MHYVKTNSFSWQSPFKVICMQTPLPHHTLLNLPIIQNLLQIIVIIHNIIHIGRQKMRSQQSVRKCSLPPPPPVLPIRVHFWTVSSTKYLHIKSTEQCLASSELLTPHPLSTQLLCPPPAPKGGRHYTLAGRWGGGGLIFRKTPYIGLASYSIIHLRFQKFRIPRYRTHYMPKRDF